MTPGAVLPLAAPAEAWWLWLLVVGLAVVVGLLVAWLRRWLLRPMRHTPSSTTDAWTEAGRRFHVMDESQRDPNGPGRDETPADDEDAP